MGYCVDGDDQFDVFLSYASTDEALNNKWISDFERYLNDKVPKELALHPDADKGRSRLFAVCRDETGFPPGGELERIIDEGVRKSQVLVIFLGRGYLHSEWCLSELDIFRENAGGELSEALSRLYLIVLDNQALDTLLEGEAPTTRRQVLWKQLQGVTKRAIRIEDFLVDGELVPVFEKDDRASRAFHAAGKRIIRDMVAKLVERRQGLQPAPAEAPEVESRAVVIGAVPARLAGARDALARRLAGVPLRLIEERDLPDAEAQVGKMQGAACLVLPFDAFAPIGGGIFLPGGHLAVQQRHFERLRDEGRVAPDAELIWWQTPPDPDVSGPRPGPADERFLDELGSLPVDRRRACTADVLGAQLQERLQGRVVSAKVWIEWDAKDDRTIEAAKKEVTTHFNAFCQRHAARGGAFVPRLEFLTADWKKLEFKFGKRDKPDGVVIVYNEEKDFEALDEQTDFISDDPDVLHKKMHPSIFYIAASGKYKPNDDWTFVRFVSSDSELSYDPDELEDFVARLFDVIARKHPGWGLRDLA